MTTRRPAVLVLLAVLAAVLMTALSGCGSSVPADRVASTIDTQLSGQGVTVDGGAVRCPGDLPAEVGRSVRCGCTAGGQPVDAVARVSSVDGGEVNLEVATQARPVSRELLATVVRDRLRAGGVRVDAVGCAGPLTPQVGQVQACTVTGGGRDTPVRTTVTEVRGGRVDFAIDRA